MTKEKFDKEYYEDWYEHRHQETNIKWRNFIYSSFINTYERLNETLALCAGKNVLDIGCGVGSWTLKIAEAAESVVGIDISEKAIQKAQASSKNNGIRNVSFKAVRLENYNPKEKFDIVYLTEVVEHISAIENIFKKMTKWLRPSGFMIITTPNSNNIFHRIRILTNRNIFRAPEDHPDPGHVNYFAPEDLRKALEACGMKVTKSVEFPFLWKEHMLIVAERSV